MFYDLKTGDRRFNANMSEWRLQAAARYSVAVIIILVAPMLAGMAGRFVSPEALDNTFVRVSIGSWERMYILAMVIVYGLVELGSWFLVNKNLEKDSKPDPRVMPMLGELCHTAGFDGAIRVIYLPSKTMLNAAATRSFFFGRKVLLFGDISKLADEELRAVLAHELAHLIMRDVRTNQPLRALMFAVNLLNFVLLLALVSSLIYRNPELTWFLVSAYVITAVCSKVAKFAYLSYSRICEYRADAIAVQLTGPEHRKHLIRAISKVKEFSLLVLLKKKEKEAVDWDQTHPSIRNRAKALGLIIKKMSNAAFARGA